ncbi:energy transducer TonB, partial [Pseudomonas viridiflava]|uniref:energy transducer TonB n=1 Tax=Pseudomonas viridiflava TaxID=33069 RepID=UPI000F094E16
MLNESRRRAYLTAMQVVNWLPRTELPFAAPSRPELLAPLPPPVEVQNELPAVSSPAPVVADNVVPIDRPSERASERPKIEVPRPTLAGTRTVAAVVEDAEPAPPKAVVMPPPRFSLQLLRAGRCMLLVELSTGQPFQSRDPSYLLLKDMLRAAGLPDSPQIIGEPVRWPLLVRGQMDQGPEAARDFVQGFVGARLEDEPCTCLWLVGLPAMKFEGEADAESFYH